MISKDGKTGRFVSQQGPMTDQLAAWRCLDLARLGRGETKTNPLVGAVLVADGMVEGEGFHARWGGPHAEVMALSGLESEDLSQARFYVSLEPCSYRGKTPACSELIVAHGIGHVSYALPDPNPLVNGSGEKALQKAGIAVDRFPDTSAPTKILHPFLTNQTEERPYIILKWAQSADGFMAKHGEQTKLTNPITDRVVHKWRSEIDAIMVGTRTAIIDDPRLSTRYYPGKSPMRIVIDRYRKISSQAALFSADSHTVLCTANPQNRTEEHITELRLAGTGDPLPALMRHLLKSHDLGVIMVEGGATLLQSFINVDLWDECRVITTPHVLDQGLSAPDINRPPVSVSELLSDEIKCYYRVNPMDTGAC